MHFQKGTIYLTFKPGSMYMYGRLIYDGMFFNAIHTCFAMILNAVWAIITFQKGMPFSLCRFDTGPPIQY